MEREEKEENILDAVKSLVLPQNFAEMTAVEVVTTQVPIRKAGKGVWFAPHPEWHLAVAVLEGTDREQFILEPGLMGELAGEWVAKTLVVCQTRQGAFFLWPIRLPGEDGKIDTWNASALTAVRECCNSWIRLRSNREVGAYDIVRPISPQEDPVWPDSPDEIYSRAIEGSVIEGLDHPLVKELQGRV